MERIIKVTVRDLIASQTCRTVYVCGNSEFVIEFDLDDEWKDRYTKTARFKWSGKAHDVVFDGSRCPVPVISDAFSFTVGVYAGNLRTTTDAYISSKKGALCGGGLPHDPPPDVYAQIMERLNAAFARIEALERGGIVQPGDSTSAALGVAVLGSMVLV